MSLSKDLTSYNAALLFGERYSSYCRLLISPGQLARRSNAIIINIAESISNVPVFLG